MSVKEMRVITSNSEAISSPELENDERLASGLEGVTVPRSLRVLNQKMERD